jgi:hypothetical protein
MARPRIPLPAENAERLSSGRPPGLPLLPFSKGRPLRAGPYGTRAMGPKACAKPGMPEGARFGGGVFLLS